MNIFERVPPASQSVVKQGEKLPTVNRYVDRLAGEDKAQRPPDRAVVTPDAAGGGVSCTHTVVDSACVNLPLLGSGRSCPVKGNPDRDTQHRDDAHHDAQCFLLIPCHGKPPVPCVDNIFLLE